MLDEVFGIYSNRIALIRSFGITDQMSVLDVGCGTGECASLTLGRYLGIDIDNQYINQVKKNIKMIPQNNYCAKILQKLKSQSLSLM